MSDDLIRRSDVLETYADLYDTFDDNKAIQEELHKVFDKLNDIPSVEPTIEIDADQLAKLLREGWTIRSEPKWIPCSERLPSKGVPVLVNGIMEDAPPITISVDAPLYYEEGWINAWMPLPEPWEGSDNA